ncbi:DUF305 domain-containing protein [Streptomyces sp. NPDC008137]|uniref:DUF305 domain-containing protein n=1 Tax=Streptomyces sp. NPDC008137 TaxID=3364813 RepID=UPI0036E10B93
MNSTSSAYNVRSLTRRSVLVIAAGAGAFLLAACGGDGDGGDSRAAAHNAQDVSFAQGMIPHHRQALEMARLADGRAASGAVEDLAARVEKAQDPEIRTMTGWLERWGEDVPGPADGMDHSAAGHSGMPGMMGGADMAELEKSEGKAFDTKFLALMVEHHEGAVKMAAVERNKGRYGPAKAMAEDIVAAQKAEIGEMNKLLGRSRG